jgi:hypothetical protein
MLEKGLAIALSISGIVAAIVVPIVLEYIKRGNRDREPSAAPHAVFGMTVETAVLRADQLAADLLTELRGQRDRAEARANELEDRVGEVEIRLDAANAELARANLPLH